MTTSKASDAGERTRRRRRWSRWLLVLAVFVTAALGTGLALRATRTPPRQPPAVDLVGADPLVARAVESATADIRKAPRSADAWGDLGMVLLAHDYYAESLPCFAEAERLAPREPRWPYYQGLVLAALRDMDTALVELRRAAELPGSGSATRLRLAEVLLGQGQLDEAEARFQALLRETPADVADPEAWAARCQLGLGQAAYQRGDAPGALTHLSACADSVFTRKTARRRLAEIRQAEGDPAAAARLLAEAEAWPDDLTWTDPYTEEFTRRQVGLTSLLKRGARLMEQDHSAEAGRLFQELVQDYPESAWAWLGLGRAQLRLTDYRSAEQAFRNAVRLGPRVPDAQFYLGVARFQLGDHRAALACFRKATELKSDYAFAHFNVAQCLKREADRAGAVTALRRALDSDPHYAEAHRDLGELLAEQGKRAEAREHLRQAVALDPTDAAAADLLRRLDGAARR